MEPIDIYRAFYALEMRRSGRLLRHDEIVMYADIVSSALDARGPSNEDGEFKTSLQDLVRRTPARSEQEARKMVDTLACKVQVNAEPLYDDILPSLINSYGLSKNGRIAICVGRMTLRLLTHDWEQEERFEEEEANVLRINLGYLPNGPDLFSVIGLAAGGRIDPEFFADSDTDEPDDADEPDD
jgi:hypothetical protein